MEARSEKHSPKGGREVRHWGDFSRLVRLIGVGLQLLGLYHRGLRNALDVRLNKIDLSFDDLPDAFDGFRILHLSDLHVDGLSETLAVASKIVNGLEVDLCVITGDFRQRMNGPFDQILPNLHELFSKVRSGHGIYAVLGNHDNADMADALEALGAITLINETAAIKRGDSEIHVIGTDDVHYYYTDAARGALETAPNGFKIALVHSAELADVAADNGFRLYLAGHTHGGQVSLPGGKPIITHMVRYRAFASGLWHLGEMVGYTTSGVGVSALPVRFNTRGEVALLTLRCAQRASSNHEPLAH